MAQYEFKVRFTYDGYVIVEAEDENEAYDKYEAVEWDDEQQTDLVDWDSIGEPKLLD